MYAGEGEGQLGSEEGGARRRDVESERGVVESVRVGALEEAHVVVHRPVGAVRRLQTRFHVFQTGAETALHLQRLFVHSFIHSSTRTLTALEKIASHCSKIYKYTGALFDSRFVFEMTV